MTLVALVTVALISLLSNVFVGSRFESYVREQHEVKTEHILNDLTMQYNGLARTWNTAAIHEAGMYALREGYIVKLYDGYTGEIIWDAENHDMTECEHIMKEISERMARRGSTGEFTSVEYPLTRNNRLIGTAQVKYFGPFFLSESDFNFLNALNMILLSAAVASLLVSFVVGWLLARRIARPIARTAEIAKQISAGNYALRFSGITKTMELDNLITTVNHLSDSLSKQEGLRKQLTADVAHELRTPIAALGSNLETMIEGVWEPTPERLQSCYEEITRLGKLVADLESLERVEGGNLALAKTPADLMELVRIVCDNFAGDFANKDLKLRVEGEQSKITIDKDRISGVISNLISNTVKYTPEGGQIRVCVRDSKHESILTVEDNGVGIPEDELPFIFERLYRADKSRNRNTGGAGIGLAIVKSVITAHGGKVEVQSKPGKGSRFVVTIPKDGDWEVLRC
jgi:signal transduction histidine kinase